LQSTIGAADVSLAYVIREEHEAGWEPPAAEVDIYAMQLFCITVATRALIESS
jgi:hypothetical protein